MANYDAQIQDLVGTGFTDQTAMDQWMADGAKEIINVMPPKLKAKCATVSLLNNSATTMDLDDVGDILYVTRLSANSGGFQVPCREIPAIYGGLATDEDSLDYYGTASDPVFWVASNTSDAGTLFVKPDPEATQVAYVHHISYPTVDASEVSIIANFPDEAEYLVVLYAATKALHQQMNSKQSDLPSDIVAPVIETISESLPTWSAPTDFVVPVKPSVPSLSAQSVTITGTAPTYVRPVFSAPTLGSVGDLSLPSAPVAPSLSVQTVADFSSSAPTYTKPVMSQTAFSSYTSGLDEADPGVLSISAVVPASPSISAQVVADFSSSAPTYTKPVRNAQTSFANYTSGLTETDPGVFSTSHVAPAVPSLSTTSVTISGTAPTFTQPVVSPDFTQVNTYIDTNEDIELASAKLQEISAQLNEYQANIQNEQIKFNEENIEYQAKLQKDIQDAQFDNQEEARKVQKYQAELSAYQANVNKDVQEYGQKLSQYQLELNTSYTSWAKTESDNISIYQADIQNELNEFNKENVIYQATVQEKIQEAQLSDANESKKLQKYQNELSSYQADVNKQVQEYGQKIAQYQLELNTSYQAWAKTESDNISIYGSNIQNELNEFNKENVIYQATIQEKMQEAQLSDSNEARKLQKYQAEVQTYQAEVNTKIQEWINEEWNQNFQKYQNDYSSLLQEYQSNIQNSLNEFNDANIEYQAKLQKDIQDAQLSDSNEARKLQKYQAEVGTYGSELNANVQVFTQELTKNRASFDTSIQKYQSEVQKVSASNASNLQKYQSEISDFSAKLQKQTTDYQWLQSQYTQLKADYQQGLQQLINGAMPQQEQGR